jgi:hypothetical protein
VVEFVPPGAKLTDILSLQWMITWLCIYIFCLRSRLSLWNTCSMIEWRYWTWVLLISFSLKWRMCQVEAHQTIIVESIATNDDVEPLLRSTMRERFNI